MRPRPVATSPLRRSWPPIALAASLTLLASAPCRADLNITVESVTVRAGSSGNALDVTVTSTGPDTVTVGSFAFELTVTTSDITFTSATTGTTTVTYIFSGNSLFGPTISTSSGQTLDASDTFATIGSGTTLGPGGTLSTAGLGHVFFDVSAGAPSGPIAVTLTPFPTTSLSDPSFNDIPITHLVNGQITVSPVPEPATFWPTALGLSAAAWLSRRSRGRRRTGPA
jgi:hypothetical protein